MIEIIFFVVFVILVVLVFIYLGSVLDKSVILRLEKDVSSYKDHLKIAERRFMQGKIKKPVFDSLVNSIEEDLISAELVLFRLKKTDDVFVSDKTERVFSKVSHPTKHRRAKIESVLREIELIRKELSILESKALKREITQSVFDKLVAKKEFELIRKEHELNSIALE